MATTSLTQTNRAFHRMLRDGVDVEYARPDGSIKGDKARLVDFADVRANDWFVVNQFTAIEAQHNRRPNVVEGRRADGASSPEPVSQAGTGAEIRGQHFDRIRNPMRKELTTHSPG